MNNEDGIRLYELDAELLAKMPADLRIAADELVILAYSTYRTPTRAARIIAYLSLLEACLEGRASRSDVETFMERRQLELAGGPVTPVSELLTIAQHYASASKDDGDIPREQTAVCPHHGYRHEYGDCTKPLGEQF